MPLLAPFESDVWTALEITDPATRDAVLAELAKAIHRDRLGRFSSGGGGGAGAAGGMVSQAPRPSPIARAAAIAHTLRRDSRLSIFDSAGTAGRDAPPEKNAKTLILGCSLVAAVSSASYARCPARGIRHRT